jgi:hypothetical protein
MGFTLSVLSRDGDSYGTKFLELNCSIELYTDRISHLSSLHFDTILNFVVSYYRVNFLNPNLQYEIWFLTSAIGWSQNKCYKMPAQLIVNITKQKTYKRPGEDVDYPISFRWKQVIKSINNNMKIGSPLSLIIIQKIKFLFRTIDFFIYLFLSCNFVTRYILYSFS